MQFVSIKFKSVLYLAAVYILTFCLLTCIFGKLQEKDVEAIKERLLEGYDNSFWTCSVSKLGYSGTAIISRVCPFLDNILCYVT